MINLTQKSQIIVFFFQHDYMSIEIFREVKKKYLKYFFILCFTTITQKTLHPISMKFSELTLEKISKKKRKKKKN